MIKTNATKEYLKQVRYCSLRIKATREKLQFFEDQVQKITPLLSPAGGGGGAGQDPLGDAVAKIADLKSILEEEEKHYAELVAEVTELLGRIQRENMRNVLERRYLRNQPWGQIVNDMHYTKDGALKLHRRALKVVEKLRAEASEQEKVST